MICGEPEVSSTGNKKCFHGEPMGICYRTANQPPVASSKNNDCVSEVMGILNSPVPRVNINMWCLLNFYNPHLVCHLQVCGYGRNPEKGGFYPAGSAGKTDTAIGRGAGTGKGHRLSFGFSTPGKTARILRCSDLWDGKENKKGETVCAIMKSRSTGV